ncbi:MAG: hypothetical protein AB1599_05435 [Planctomycetota bacterium]
MLKPNEVKTPHIATFAVTASKIAVNAITTDKIKEGAVKTEKIGDKQVTGDKIADRSISTTKIIDGAITGTKIAEGAITRDKISNGVLDRPLTPPVATVEIGTGAVGSSQLAVGSVTTEKIKDGAITNAKIAANTITAAKIAANAVGSSEIAPNAVGYSELAPQSLEPRSIKTLSGAPATEGQVPVADLSQGNQWWFKWANVATRPMTPPLASEEIANGAVGSSQLAVNSVTTEKIQNGAVTTPKIASSAVTSSQLSVDSVSTEKIQNGAVTQEKLAPGVGGDRFVFGTLLTGLGSADVLYLTNISADIPYTVFDLSPWIPAQAKAVILQLGIFNQSFANGRAFFRVRTNTDQRDALGVGLVPGANSQVVNQGIVPLVVGTPSIEYTLESVGGPWVATLTLYVTVVGYVV